MVRVTSLASGSSGNAFLVETPEAPLLVEAGLSARMLERYLRQREIDPATLGAIIVSHEHHDHAQGAGPLARRWNVPVVASPATKEALGNELVGVAWLPLEPAGVLIGTVAVWGFPLPHDAVDPQGVVVQYGAVRMGWALDLGHVPEHLVTALANTDLVVIEANHDREKLIKTLYPWSTKHRILGEQGHLSNMQAAEFIAALAGDEHPRTVWLAHLSAQANDHPRGVLRYIENYLAMAGVANVKLAIAERDKPSVSWQSNRLEQQTLFDWGEV